MKIFEYILGGLVGILTAINIPKWIRLNWKEKTLAIVGIIFALVVAYDGVKEYLKMDIIEKINASYGDIYDVQDATLPAIGLGMREDAPKFITNEQGTFNLIIGNVLFKNMVKVYIKKNKLFINMIIYDSTGTPVAGIFENTWKIYSSDFEYNYDDHAIEVVTNGTHELLFHLELRKGIVHLEGSIYLPKTDSSLNKPFRGIKIFTDAYGGGVIPLDGSKNDIDKSIPNIFKYPKEKYWGVRVNY